MIRCDHVYAVLRHGPQQRLLVRGALDGRVAFDVGALVGVPALVEEEMVDARFGGDLLAAEVAGLEQRHLARCGEVQHV